MKKITAPTFKSMKKRGEKIVMLTAYDATFAKLVDIEGIDGILVGDSLGMVIQGHTNTLPVTVDDIIYHTKAVSKGLSRAHLVADMPFMSYQVSSEEAIKNAGKIIKDGNAEAVKIEGGEELFETIRKIVKAGIPVMGHIGLCPQTIHQIGGYKVQGKKEQHAQQLLKDAQLLEEAGIYSLVLEGIPMEVAKTITEKISIPTIGIGAGPFCDGQILVIYDLLGMDEKFTPKFLKKFANLGFDIKKALSQYSNEVKEGIFPDKENSFSINDKNDEKIKINSISYGPQQ